MVHKRYKTPLDFQLKVTRSKRRDLMGLWRQCLRTRCDTDAYDCLSKFFHEIDRVVNRARNQELWEWDADELEEEIEDWKVLIEEDLTGYRNKIRDWERRNRGNHQCVRESTYYFEEADDLINETLICLPRSRSRNVIADY